MMQIKIKTKLSLGLGFLFAVIILIGSVGAYYIHAIAKESKEILTDNYESIQYSKSMLQSLDTFDSDTLTFVHLFERNLKRQENNITEIGEKEYTEELREEFMALKRSHFSTSNILKLKKILYKLLI